MKHTNKFPKVLAVDDTQYNLEILESSLEMYDINIICASSGKQAIHLAQTEEPNLILLDIMMPEMDGYKVCEILKKDPETKNIPIIFLSALHSPEDKIKAFKLGAVDYISKPFNPMEVIARVQTHLKLHTMLDEMNQLLKHSFHELYTPLGIISSSLELQELEYGSNENLQSIKAASRSLHSIYEDIYYALKKEIKIYPPQWIDLSAFTQKRLVYFTPLMQTKELKYNFHSSLDSAMIYINESELERLFDNLVSNAVKYARENSILNIYIQEKTDMIEFSISNTGKTIKDPKKVFKELYREESSIMGLGIGLSIVKSICKKHNIDVDVSSTDGLTTFYLRYKDNV